MLNIIDDSGIKIPNEVSELSNPDTHFDRQPQSHHLLTGETVRTNQVPDFLKGRTRTPHKQQSHQYQNLSTQVSNDIKLPMIEHTPKN